ncbi:MAG: hypothetical protein RL277_2503 [Planctomycetota bacterium]|jgi:hypothetical protein
MKRWALLVPGILVGALAGATLNMGVLLLGSKLMPNPPGVDVNDPASINAHIHEYSVLQLLVPFLAHALGTFAGAFLAARFNRGTGLGLLAALVVGALFLFGGISMVMVIPNAPLWFDALDLVLAYVPMALLGYALAGAKAPAVQNESATRG